MKNNLIYKGIPTKGAVEFGENKFGYKDSIKPFKLIPNVSKLILT